MTVDHKEARALVDPLRNGQQCDEDGVMCISSRQLCHEAADAIAAALAEIERLREARDADWNDAIHAAIPAVRGLDFEYTEPVLLALRDLLRKENDQ